MTTLPHKLVRVRWVDACEPDCNSDLELSDAPEPQNVDHVGFLISDRPGHIVLASLRKPFGGTSTFDYMTCIPKCCIESIRQLDESGDLPIDNGRKEET